MDFILRPRLAGLAGELSSHWSNGVKRTRLMVRVDQSLFRMKHYFRPCTTLLFMLRIQHAALKNPTKVYSDFAAYAQPSTDIYF